MSLEKVAEMDGREVWLAVMDGPEDVSSWAGTARPSCGVLVFLGLDSWDPDQTDLFVAAVLQYAPSEVAVAGEACSDLEAAFEQGLSLHPSDSPAMVTAHPDKELDEAVWYMFYATIPTLPAGVLRQPPLVVAFARGDERAERFRAVAARFSAAMNDVLERE